jgi:hypothetical protein
VYELIWPKGNGHMRSARLGCGKKQQISGGHFTELDGLPDPVLVAHFAWQRDLVLSKHVLRKSTAVESMRIAAAISVRGTAKLQRRRDDSVPSASRNPDSGS